MLTISNFKNSVEAMGSRLHVKLEEVELLLERAPDTSDFARRSTNKRQQHPQKRILAKYLYGDRREVGLQEKSVLGVLTGKETCQTVRHNSC